MDKIAILIIEDDEADYYLLCQILQDGGGMQPRFEVIRARSLHDACSLLADGTYEVVLTDLGLPDSQGLETFRRLHAEAPQTPLIVFSGLNDEDVALEAVREGAQDYLVKGEISYIVLIKAIRYAIERQRLKIELEQSLKEIKTLRGILPICSRCKKIRNDEGAWTQLEVYVHERTEADFSHGCCPECARDEYPELYEILRQNGKVR